ncbi:DEAD/DEAH box helicase [Marinomonas epiphytica]
MAGYFSTLKQQANSRAKEATLSVLGINKPNLRNHLNDLFESDEPFVHGPVFEQMFGWEPHTEKVGELNNILSPKIIDALDHENNGRYSFKKDWSPFKHQYQAWTDLLDETPKSRIITSGTGSGKTECFMVPVLEDLYRETVQTGQALTGVRAIFLYPLNALINSQRERLNAWTKHFEGDIRFCLYNGKTPEKLKSKESQKQTANPQDVMSRQGLRDDPAPILVTNGTMLEYMLIRQADAPIIKKSKGKLRWIVLDEAHTYIGSQAAELALQLRRVMQAFEVKAEDIRFVATSATIAGKEAEDSLRRYLANLANISVDQVAVIGGKRIVPKLNKVDSVNRTIDEIESIDPEGQLPLKPKEEQKKEVSSKRFRALEESRIAVSLRNILTAEGSVPKSIYDLVSDMSDFKLKESEIFRWIDLCTNTKETSSSEAFLKVRSHYYQRTLSGLWSCVNPTCSHKQHTKLQQDWPYGYVYTKQRPHCECGSPVLEIAFCNVCSEPHLLGSFDTNNSKLVPWIDRSHDEFSLTEGDSDEESDNSDNSDGSENEQYQGSRSSGLVVIGANESSENDYHLRVFSKDGIESFGDGDFSLALRDEQEKPVCSDCGHSGRGVHGQALRRCMLGAPFYSTNVVPTILEYCPDFEPEDDAEVKRTPAELPARGRRLITFTDSRQGTAKMSVSMQQEAERSLLRGIMVRELKNHLEEKSDLDDAVFEKVKMYMGLAPDVIQDFILLQKDKDPELAKALEQYLESLSAEKVTNPTPITWHELVRELKLDQNVSHSMTWENRYLDPDAFDVSDATTLSEMILTREIARRPKYRNNVETQGLVRIVYSGIEAITSIPENWSEHGHTLKDWKDFLVVCMNFHVRENTFVQLNKSWTKWIGMRFYEKHLISPESKDDQGIRVKPWPQVRSKAKQQSRLISLLAKGSKLDPTEERTKVIINGWLQAAWNCLVSGQSKTLSEFTGKQYQLRLDTISFSLMTKAYICPVTNKLIDTVFKGITPYIPWNKDPYKEPDKYLCKQVDLPKIWQLDTSTDNSRYISAIRDNVASNDIIKQLRQQNLWTDINDRVVEGGVYYTTAEHSAQQSSEKLEKYEERFKHGQKNVLNCSTTMEMGVDIGGISAVVMNNVPPHPANYLQRAGRAGRSKEARAVGFTLCKNNPHDQYVFNNPKWPFETNIPAPHVAFSSAKIVQRHINAFLLGTFLRNVIGETSKEKFFLNLEWFYTPEASSNVPCTRFINWLEGNQFKLQNEIKTLTSQTKLENSSVDSLVTTTSETIKLLSEKWLKEYQFIQSELASADKDGPYAYKLNGDLNRLCNEYLLRDLACRGFLPGYGFPTDVVNLNVGNLEDYLREKEGRKNKQDEREDNVAINRGLPSRNLAVAIREYAPGTEIVLDGRVHKTAGISLGWQKAHVEGLKETQKFDVAWHCSHCGQTGYEPDLSQQNNIMCSNSACAKPIKIKDQRKVIQPTGFVADFYLPPSNNISQTAYIPVQEPWVMGKGDKVTLPNSELGYMVVDTSGHVFHHSSGLYGTGYALCLGCGRAESMTATEEYPKSLNPEGTHRPPMPNKFQRDENGKPECGASGKIMESIHLGFNTTTDVFELVLRNPVTAEYLNNKSIAITIAVALRETLVDQLGISSNEVGYGTRPAIVGQGNKAQVIQLFDTVSGGAGFSISAAAKIKELLKGMKNVLECKDQCDRYCHSCLLESDSRHDIDRLDRKTALTWLNEADFDNHLDLPAEYQNMLGSVDAIYNSMPIKEKLAEQLRNKPFSVKFILSRNIEDWDTSLGFLTSYFHRLLGESLNVQVVVPEIKWEGEVRDFLAQLSAMKVDIVEADVKVPAVVQVCYEHSCKTIGCLDDQSRTLGENWLNSSDISVTTDAIPEITGKVLSFTEPLTVQGAVDIAVKNELNGSLKGFGLRILELLSKKDSRLANLFDNEKLISINYTDRYLQSPSSLLMLGELLSSISNQDNYVTVTTCFDEKGDYPGHVIHHDWRYEDDYEVIFKGWIKQICGPNTSIQLAKKSDIPHRRSLNLEFESGSKAQIIFDQGLGYWRLKVGRGLHNFDFRRSIPDQVTRLGDARDNAQISHRDDCDWDTFITVGIEIGDS